MSSSRILFFRFPLFSALFVLFVLLAPAQMQAATAPPLRAVVSIAPQKYMLERIAGERVAVTVLVKPGSDPHAYEPDPAQMRACAAADLWFTIGVPFEDIWLPRIQGAVKSLAIVSSIEGITRLRVDDGHGHEHGHDKDHPHDTAGGEDPHVWLSPMLVRSMVPALIRELAQRMPEHAASFHANGKAFADELEALDRRLAARFAEFPREQRGFLTFHPSWRYFARNYDLTELSVEVNGKEPGSRSMKAIVDAARKHGILTVFVEPQFPKAAARAIADNIGAKVVEVNPLAENLPALYTDMADKLLESFQR